MTGYMQLLHILRKKITKRSNTVSGIRDRWNVRRCMKGNRSTVLTFTFAVTQWRFGKLVQRCAWNVNHHHQHNERRRSPKETCRHAEMHSTGLLYIVTTCEIYYALLSYLKGTSVSTHNCYTYVQIYFIFKAYFDVEMGDPLNFFPISIGFEFQKNSTQIQNFTVIKSVQM